VIDNGGIIIGGSGSSLWSLLLLLGALFMVRYQRQPTDKEQRIAFVLVTILLIGYGIPNMIVSHTTFIDITRKSEARPLWRLYGYVRLSLIGLCFIFLLHLYYVMLQTSAKGDRKRHPLYHLLRKITPYPIIQSISRFGASSYSWIYGTSAFSTNAEGWQIFWTYVNIILMPSVGIWCLITFIHVTTGAKRSLIQMLHLECIFTLSPPPAKWAEEHEKNDRKLNIESETPRDWLQQKRKMRQSTCQKEHDRLIDMDEHDLATEVAQFRKELSVSSMSENEVTPGDSITDL
jgi:hypothetical protein